MKLKKGQFFQWKKADVQLTAISHIHLQERYGSEDHSRGKTQGGSDSAWEGCLMKGDICRGRNRR